MKGIYNRNPNVKYGMTGHKHSDESKKVMSLRKKGRHISPNTEFKKGNISFSKLHPEVMKKGKDHYNWKGGITPLRIRLYQHYQHRQWRSDIFTRDDFTCQHCGIKGAYLEAHHCPKTFADILEEYKFKTFEDALDCEELWNINNGITLCRECHNKTKNGRRK